MWFFQYFICLLSLVLIGNACGSETASASVVGAVSDQPGVAQQTPPDGAAIYRQYCVACHGVDGKLGLNGAGDLTKSTLSLKERITQISKGKNMMAPFEEILSAPEIKAVAKYTLSLKK